MTMTERHGALSEAWTKVRLAASISWWALQPPAGTRRRALRAK